MTFGVNRSFAKHIEKSGIKVESRAGSLRGIMPNIGKPSSAKRKALSQAVEETLLNRAPIWEAELRKEKYSRMLASTQRRALLSVTSALGGSPAGDIRNDTSVSSDQDKQGVVQSGRWKTGRKKRQVDHGTDLGRAGVVQLQERNTQLLPNSGAHRAYTEKYAGDSSGQCRYCGEMDTQVQYTIFACLTLSIVKNNN